MDVNVLSTLISIVIGILIILVLWKMFIRSKEKAKQIIDETYDYISDHILDTIMDLLQKAKRKDFSHITFDEFKNSVLGDIKTGIFVEVQNLVDKLISENKIPENARNYITVEQIDEFVELIINRFNVEERIQEIYVDDHRNHIENPENDPYNNFTDLDGNPIDVNDPENFNTEDENEDPVLEPYIPQEVPSDILSHLNPREEEDDDAVEEQEVYEQYQEDSEKTLTDQEIAEGIHFDKNGRKRDARGRFVK